MGEQLYLIGLHDDRLLLSTGLLLLSNTGAAAVRRSPLLGGPRQEVLSRVGGRYFGTLRRVCSRFLEVDFIELLHEPTLLLGIGGQAEGLMGLFRGLRGTFRLLLRAFRELLGARLLLNTRCRLLDLLHCRGFLRWWWLRPWASPILVQVLGQESSLNRGHLWVTHKHLASSI